LSSSKKFADVAAVSLAVVGTVAIVVALAVGLTGWPPTRAEAAPAIVQGGIGIGDRTSGPVLTFTPSEDKVTVEATPIVVAALVSAAPKKAAPIPVAKRAPRVAKATVRRSGSKSYPAARATGGFRTCRVSWYGPGFYGHTMAGGGQLTPTSMVVAHRSLPFGTRVLIKYRGRSVTAVVRDRGPYVSGRTFDLGPGTAKALGFSGVGTISYRIL
jgi:rare lipoprotein A (peptidoglycan hydrolase)